MGLLSNGVRKVLTGAIAGATIAVVGLLAPTASAATPTPTVVTTAASSSTSYPDCIGGVVYGNMSVTVGIRRGASLANWNDGTSCDAPKAGSVNIAVTPPVDNPFLGQVDATVKVSKKHRHIHNGRYTAYIVKWNVGNDGKIAGHVLSQGVQVKIKRCHKAKVKVSMQLSVASTHTIQVLLVPFGELPESSKTYATRPVVVDPVGV